VLGKGAAVAVNEQLAEQGPIPITVVTGFLGAGKTSLINRVVKARAGTERIGVVVNEAGEVGLDGQLLGESGDDVVEIADGCVCCTSQGELLDAITRLHRAAGHLDRIIVETSGLADPGPVVDALASITHVLRLDTMVTVVDALHMVDQLDRVEAPEARSQLQLATHVVVSKIDLADDAAIEEVRARAGALNPDAEVIAVARDDLDIGLLLDRFVFAADDAHTGFGHPHEHHHDHLEVEIFSLELAGEMDPRRFEGWLGSLLMLNAPDVFRIKAIVALAGQGRRQIIHGVQTYVEQAPGDEWGADEPRVSRIVVIGRNLESDMWRSELERSLVA
jgi:G3E family GTPase